MEKSKDVILRKKEDKVPAIYEADQSLIASLDGVDPEDFVFPRLTLIQPTSKIPGNAGDIIDSSTGEVLAKMGERLSFVLCMSYKDFAITNTATKKFVRNETLMPKNRKHLVYQDRFVETPEGRLEYIPRIKMFIVLSKDLSQPMPQVYQLIVKKSSFPEARKVLTDWGVQQSMRQPPYQYVWSLRPKLVTDDKGKYVVLEFLMEIEDGKRARVASNEMPQVEYWVRMLQSNKNSIARTVDPEEPSVIDVSGHEEEATPF